MHFEISVSSIRNNDWGWCACVLVCVLPGIVKQMDDWRRRPRAYADARALTPEDYPEEMRPKLREFEKVRKEEEEKLAEPVHDGKRMG